MQPIFKQTRRGLLSQHAGMTRLTESLATP